jgi:hypothetical protein
MFETRSFLLFCRWGFRSKLRDAVSNPRRGTGDDSANNIVAIVATCGRALSSYQFFPQIQSVSAECDLSLVDRKHY